MSEELSPETLDLLVGEVIERDPPVALDWKRDDGGWLAAWTLPDSAEETARAIQKRHRVSASATWQGNYLWIGPEVRRW